METQPKITNAAGATQKAGAIVLHHIAGQPCALLVHRPKHKDWQFPKGHMEGSESPATTAAREVREETGYTIALGTQLPTFSYTRKAGERVDCHFFLATVDEAVPATPAEEDPACIPLPLVSQHIDSENLRQYFIEIYSQIPSPLTR